MDLDDKQWKEKLTRDQYEVLRHAGTEAPFSGKLLYNRDAGEYKCAACGATLFSSQGKYESNTPGLSGWPSFSEVAKSGAVDLIDDNSLGMHRIEVRCKNCGSHLGHLFDDEDSPSGKHYCINSVALDFKPAKEEPKQ